MDMPVPLVSTGYDTYNYGMAKIPEGKELNT